MKLILEDGSSVGQPSTQDIEKYLARLDGENNGFAILEVDAMNYMQAAGDPTNGYTLEYQVQNVSQHYQAVESVNHEAVVMAFSKYAEKDASWMDAFAWKKLNLEASTGKGAGCTGVLVMGLLFLILVLGGCTTDSREKLVIYSPHGPEQLQEYEDRYEAAFPEVDLQWIDMGGQDAYDRIRTESQNPQASLWWGGAGPAFARATKEGLLEPYTPSWAAHAAPGTFDRDHHWYGTYLTPEVIAYNTDNLDTTTAPKDWDDLLDPAWQDRIIIRYPLASSTMRTIYGAMILRQPSVEEGYRWLARLDQNTKAYTPDPTYMYLRLGRGEADVSLWNMTDVFIQSATYPFSYLIPSSGTPVLSDGIALVKNGPNLERAREFYEFVTTDSALVHQAHTFYRIPTRQDIPDAQLPDWITSVDIQAMEIDWERLETEGPVWMQYWDENIKGRGAEYLAEQAP